MSITDPLLMTFVAYLLVITAIAYRAYKQTQDLGDYILGGRKLGRLVTALSVGASDMSGWLLLGLPGAIFLSGISESWIAIGLLAGAYCNWRFVAKPLRIQSEQANNSLTLPEFLENRFKTSVSADARFNNGRVLRLLSATVILLFFTFYTASGLVGGAILFESSFGLSYHAALLIGALIIVLYTFAGGFLAVCWTDAMQSLLMLAALIYTPLAVINSLGGAGSFWQMLQAVEPQNVDLMAGMNVLGILSLLAWGLGYVGQPHILTRFMAIKDAGQLANSRRLAMSWMVLVLLGSILTGLAAIPFFIGQELDNPETVFISLSQALFNPWVAGIITAAILSAIMSTIDSQLLICSSVVSEDFYRVYIRPEATEKELLWLSRLAVVAIAIVALLIASDRNSRVLDLVSYAWAGFGAAFGPVILFSLFWKKMTANAAIAGMIVGALTVIIWSKIQGGLFDLYEIIPGFLFASGAIVLTVWSLAGSESARAGASA